MLLFFQVLKGESCPAEGKEIRPGTVSFADLSLLANWLQQHSVLLLTMCTIK